MSPMAQKSTFEPKDPRIINLYEDDDGDEDDLDDWSLTTSSDVTQRPRRKKTTTQALVEFLNTTSPEEFQKNTPKRTSNLFFRRRKNKTSSSRPTPSSSTPPSPMPTTASVVSNASSMMSNYTRRAETANRKNYIEILTHQQQAPLPRESGSLGRVSASRTNTIASRQSMAQSPVLPANWSINKRESSLYSDSIRQSISTRGSLAGGRPLMRHDTDVTLASRASNNNNNNNSNSHSHNHNNTLNSNPSTYGLSHRRTSEHTFGNEDDDLRERKATELLIARMAGSEMDAIEAGLAQRLERFRLAKAERPGNVVAAGLATEHVRALQASSQEQQQMQEPWQAAEEQEQEQDQDHHPLPLPKEGTSHAKNKRKVVRHMQVQTMPIEDQDEEGDKAGKDTYHDTVTATQTTTTGTTITTPSASTSTSTPSSPPQSQSPKSPTSPTDDHQTIEQLERQLAEEQRERRRLELTLDETVDHFETLSGLAYKKLRELWEEKMHWENACIELRDRLLEASHRSNDQLSTTSEHPQDPSLVGYPDSDYVVQDKLGSDIIREE